MISEPLFDKLVKQLNDRDLEILGLHAKGMTATEIAAHYAPPLSNRTIENHIFRLVKKFEAKNKTELVCKLAEKKVIKL